MSGPDPPVADRSRVRVCLAGDVLVGRGIDQILTHPGDPTIHEPWLRSTLQYVDLAELQSGPLPQGVDPDYIWGDMLERLDAQAPMAFIVKNPSASRSTAGG
jgi:poly-gamma-glutamate synthesis protein (capsule biosynthesis protein)